MILLFVLGMIIGSFINVVIYRLPRGMTLFGRSACPKCGERIRWFDLIPVASYLILKGKCRFCKNKISPEYPLVELATGVLFALAYAVFGLSADFLYSVLLILGAGVLGIIDGKTGIIEDKIVLFLGVLGIFGVVFGINNWISALIGAFIVSVPFLIIAFFGGMGGGDVKLMAAAGLCLGWPKTLLSLLIASVAGGVYVVYLAIRGNLHSEKPHSEKPHSEKPHRRKEVPFGPFLALGIITASLAGTPIISWYLSTFIA
jgi:prepilin signal peptidase PulO-like enzyme (type II secretory pathway)